MQSFDDLYNLAPIQDIENASSTDEKALQTARYYYNACRRFTDDESVRKMAQVLADKEKKIQDLSQ